MTASQPILHLDGVRKSYGKFEALKGISLDIAKGEIVGLLGPNGAGKSTLFQVATGLFAPDAGTVELFGLDYRRHSAEILTRLGVVFQTRSVDLDMTVGGNLRFHGALFGLSGKDLKSRIADATELLEMGDLVDKRVRALSGGNQRRVEVARALLNRPDLLLMDEPSVGLDATMRSKLVDHMQLLCRERGTSILWATHIVEELVHANRIVLIVAGRIVAAGTPAELMAETGKDNLTDVYVSMTGVQPATETAHD